MSKESKSKKSGGRLKFEKIDLQEALKDVTAPSLPTHATSPLPGDDMDAPYDARLTEVSLATHGVDAPAAPSPMLAPSSVLETPPVHVVQESSSVAATPAAPCDYVPIAAVGAMQVDRMREATNGLLREPGPPPAGIPRVTKDGENSPPMPTELMQLLTA